MVKDPVCGMQVDEKRAAGLPITGTDLIVSAHAGAGCVRKQPG